MASRLLSAQRERKHSFTYLLVLLAVMISCGVVLTRFQPEVGLSVAGNGAVGVVAAVSDVAAASRADAGFDEYSAVLRVAIAKQRSLGVQDTADGRVSKLMGRALECYTAIREARLAIEQDGWDDQTHGLKEYWVALHPGLELGAPGKIDYMTLVESCEAQAEELLDEVLDLVAE